MYYEEYGKRENPTIIFLHGAMAFHSFERQQELSDEFNLIFYTLPGHGMDSGREFDRQLAIKEIIGLIGSLDKGKVHLVGFSLGAQIALSLLNAYPHYFDRAALISPLVDSSESDRLRLSLSTRIVGYTTKFSPMAKIVGRVIGIDRKKYGQFEIEQKKQKVNKLSSGILKDMLMSKDLSRIKEIDNRVLILAGEYEFGSYKKTALKLSYTVKNAEIEIYRGAAHNIPYKFYKKFNSQLRRFLKEI